LLGKLTSAAAVALASSAFGAPAVAQAATTHHKRHHTRRNAAAQASSSSTGSSSDSSGRSSSSSATVSAETELTGETATKANEAALAAIRGGMVTRASIENPSDPSKATYEVHVRKSDGNEVVVLLDAALKALATGTSAGGGCG
jgi:uncharacterized membrane protein YkoI